MPIFNLI